MNTSHHSFLCAVLLLALAGSSALRAQNHNPKQDGNQDTYKQSTIGLRSAVARLEGDGKTVKFTVEVFENEEINGGGFAVEGSSATLKVKTVGSDKDPLKFP